MRIEIVEESQTGSNTLNADNFGVSRIDVRLSLKPDIGELPDDLPTINYTVMESDQSMMIVWELTTSGRVNWLLGGPISDAKVNSVLELRAPAQRATAMVLLQEMRNRIRNRMITMKVELPPFWEIPTSGSVMFDVVAPE